MPLSPVDQKSIDHMSRTPELRSGSSTQSSAVIWIRPSRLHLGGAAASREEHLPLLALLSRESRVETIANHKP